MADRVLVTAGGTGPTNSLIRSLRAGDPTLGVVACHDDRFLLKKSIADRNYLLPGREQPVFADALRDVIAAEGIGLIVPNTDLDVRTISDLRAELPTRVLLPRPAVVDLCQDKYELSMFLRSRQLPAPATYLVTDPKQLEEVFGRLAPHTTLWCRIRSGTGSRGALPVKRPEHVRNWIRYWRDMRGVPATAFTVSEYLPGRDFNCESLWYDGVLVLVKTAERLSYFLGADRPSGTSSNAALAKTVYDRRLVETCSAVVRALDPEATGLFSIDFKEDAAGQPCVTEINVGRVLSTTTMFDLVGKHNMALTYVRLGLGTPVHFRDEYDAPEDYYFVRDIDALPDLVHADSLFEGILEVSR
jgi:carbamoylphosphate synthase large subunit